MSLYAGEIVQPSVLAVQLARLRAAFPRQEPDFWNLLAERVLMNGFTEKRLTDSVNKIIDHFHYKELNIADIVSFDRRRKLYTYGDVFRTAGCFPSSEFELVIVEGKRLYAKINEL